MLFFFFFFNQKTAYEMRISDWSSDVCSSDLLAVRTDNLHYESDLFLNLSVIAALVLEQVGGVRGADALFGLGISLWLAWNAWRAANHAIDELMDREWPEEKRQHFLAVASQHPELKGIHDLRTRTSGTHDFRSEEHTSELQSLMRISYDVF